MLVLPPLAMKFMAEQLRKRSLISYIQHKRNIYQAGMNAAHQMDGGLGTVITLADRTEYNFTVAMVGFVVSLRFDSAIFCWHCFFMC